MHVLEGVLATKMDLYEEKLTIVKLRLHSPHIYVVATNRVCGNDSGDLW